MDREEIKLHLVGYRPELYRDDDPLIAEALAAAKADPELSRWLDEKIAFDREFAINLSELSPPVGARDALLEAAASDRSRRRSRRHWKWAAAAVVLLSAGLAIKHFAFPPPVQFAQTESITVTGFRDHMAQFANSRFVLDKTFRNMDRSRLWLTKKDFPSCSAIPDQLARYRGIGCKAIDWNGTKVGLICFKNDQGKTVHLFIVDTAAFRDHPPEPESLRSIAVHRDLETGGWIDGDTLFLLVGSGPDVPIGEHLPS